MAFNTLEDRFKNDIKVRDAINYGRDHGKLSIRRKQMQIMNEHNNWHGNMVRKAIVRTKR